VRPAPYGGKRNGELFSEDQSARREGLAWQRIWPSGFVASARFLAFEGVCRLAFGLEAADDKKPSGVFFLGGFVDPGGDEEIGEVRATKGAGGGFQARQGDAMEFIAGFRIETGNAATVAKSDP
jgi:hypothetical protein